MKTTRTYHSQAGSVASHNRQTRWICWQWTDVAMAVSWMPFSLLALAVVDNAALLKTLMFGTFLFSFTHQPLSLFLVYGDREKFGLRRNLFTWSPLVFGIAVFFAVNHSPVLLAILTGAWNTGHTLMQRYGIARIYGRIAGQTQGGGLLMFFSWLILVVIWAAADPNTLEHVSALGIRGANGSTFELLTGLRPFAEWLLMPIFIAMLGIAAKWLWEEYNRPVNLAKHCYPATTLGLFIMILINPIVGFIGYVGTHAYEYFVIVNRSLEKSYIEPKRTDSGIGWLANARIGRVGLLAFYLALIVMTVYLLENFASFIVYSMVFFTLVALHFFCDGFIWTLRNPRVAKSVGAEA